LNCDIDETLTAMQLGMMDYEVVMHTFLSCA
jgi:hypothetical protein